MAQLVTISIILANKILIRIEEPLSSLTCQLDPSPAVKPAVVDAAVTSAPLIFGWRDHIALSLYPCCYVAFFQYKSMLRIQRSSKIVLLTHSVSAASQAQAGAFHRDS